MNGNAISFQRLWFTAGALGRLLTSSAMLVMLALAVTGRYWAAAEGYLFLWSFELAPSGSLAYTALILLAALSAASFALMGRQLVSLSRAGRKLRGDAEPGAEAALETERAKANKKVPRYMLITWLAITLAVAPAASLSSWHDLQSPSARLVKGRVRVLSPQDQLHDLLRTLKSRGIFTWLESANE